MEYKYFNPNPDEQLFKSGKPKTWTRDDSAIRALAGALDKSWEEIFNKLVEIAKKNHDIITSKNVVMDFCAFNNFSYETFGKPTIGTKRPSVEEFINEHQEGTYIIYFANYFECVKDGVYMDVKNQPKGSVYSYWKLN